MPKAPSIIAECVGQAAVRIQESRAGGAPKSRAAPVTGRTTCSTRLPRRPAGPSASPWRWIRRPGRRPARHHRGGRPHAIAGRLTHSCNVPGTSAAVPWLPTATSTSNTLPRVSGLAGVLLLRCTLLIQNCRSWPKHQCDARRRGSPSHHPRGCHQFTNISAASSTVPAASPGGNTSRPGATPTAGSSISGRKSSNSRPTAMVPAPPRTMSRRQRQQAPKQRPV